MSREVMRQELGRARQWIASTPHGDNCFVSSHYEGDPGDRCNCGKDAVLDAIDEALNAAIAKPDDKAQPVAYYTDIPGHRVYAEKPHDFDEDGLTFKFDGVIYRYEDYWTPLYAAPQPPAEQPFQPDWMNYRQGVVDGKAEAEQGAELSDYPPLPGPRHHQQGE